MLLAIIFYGIIMMLLLPLTVIEALPAPMQMLLFAVAIKPEPARYPIAVL